MKQYTEMSTQALINAINNLDKVVKQNENYGSKITLLNAMHYRDCAIDVLETRQLEQANQEIEQFMKHQANMRDHEYELETMHEWEGIPNATLQ